MFSGPVLQKKLNNTDESAISIELLRPEAPSLIDRGSQETAK